jgi:hypothetical protein
MFIALAATHNLRLKSLHAGSKLLNNIQHFNEDFRINFNILIFKERSLSQYKSNILLKIFYVKNKHDNYLQFT